MSAPPPSKVQLTVCRLWERRNRAGELFMSGTMGGVRVLIVPNQNRADDTDAEFVMVLAEGRPDRKPRKERT